LTNEERESMSDQPQTLPLDSPVAARSPAKSRRWLAVASIVAFAGLLGGGWYSYSQQTPAPREGGPRAGGGRDRLTPIVVEAARTENFPLRLAAVGTVVPRNIVTLRSRVDGTLDRVLFAEGQVVRAGELLAEIDPRPFEVTLTQAQGQLGRDHALLANARADLRRYEGLAKLDAIPVQQLDTQRALVGQYEAAIKADQGAVDGARLQLSYTHITAPFEGRVGLRQVDPGNMVRSSDANGIVVITQVQPVTVVFSIPEAELGKLLARLGMQTPREARRNERRRDSAAGAQGQAADRSGAAKEGRARRERTSEAGITGEKVARREPPPGGRSGAGRDGAAAAGRNAGSKRSAAAATDIEVEAWDRDGKQLLASGTLLTVDNQLDATTGTVKVKAIFPNTDGALFPNQFVNVRLVVSELKDATVIPAAAAQRGARGTFVWLLQAEAKTVSMRQVSLGAVDGESVAVLEGLKAGEQVAVDGFDRLREGARVEVVTHESRAVKEGPDKRGPRGSRRGEGGQRPAGAPREGGAAAGPPGPRPQP
jgi:multidrug efflux system membrane fusion protein